MNGNPAEPSPRHVHTEALTTKALVSANEVGSFEST